LKKDHSIGLAKGGPNQYLPGVNTTDSFDLLSPLYTRYNGFTLGAFLASCRLKFSTSRYTIYRGRIIDFLQELGIEFTLPKTQRLYVSQADEIINKVLVAVRDKSENLYDFTGLGAMAVLYGVNISIVDNEQHEILRNKWQPILNKYGIYSTVYEEFISNLLTKKTSTHAEDFLSTASLFLTRLIEPLKVESDTCFVAMPFKAPFINFFMTFYRPALLQNGLRAIRAWGGLSSEEYYMMLLAMISRSGNVLAELTTANLNVINEIGIAHGCLKVVFLIMRSSQTRVPSNISHLPIFTYSSEKNDGLDQTIQNCANYINWISTDYYKRLARDAKGELP
jgi:hypothetical protein